MTPSETIDIVQKMQNFSTLAIILMLVLIYNYEDEIKNFENVFQLRFFSPETHGNYPTSYVSKFSYMTSGMFFICNFVTFMFYF